jgi:hypothetical protein
LLFHFGLEYAIRKVQEDQVGLNLNETHQLQVYADDLSLLRDNINAIKKKTEAVIDASKEVGLEVNTEKTKYMLISNHQNVGQYHNIKRSNRSFENVAHFKSPRIRNQNLIHEEIKSRLNLGSTCYHSVQNFLSSHLLSENVKIKIHKTVILL